MMFNWTPDMVRFMKDASEYGDYNSVIAGTMRPYINENTRICDAGCGLGYLSLELSALAGQVTAVDVNEDALSVLRGNIASRNIENIEVVSGRLEDLQLEKPFDAMVFCFAGEISDVLEQAGRLCRGDVFVIHRNYKNHRFSAGDFSCDEGCLCFTDELDRRGIPYEARELEIEFGQPLRSIDDGVLFYRTYSRDPDKSVIDRNFLENKLIKTGCTEFPYYLPHRRRVEWIMLKAGSFA